MDVLEMAAQVSTLSECLVTLRAREGSLPSVLPKVVTQVTTLLKCAPAARMLAFKIEFDALSQGVLHSDRLVPLLGDALEGLRLHLLLNKSLTGKVHLTVK